MTTPETTPAPSLALRPLAELHVEIAEPIDAGQVRAGQRLIIPITGGTVTGRISGRVVPGGADWAIARDDGTTLVSATYALRTDDGVILTVFNQGSLRSDDGAALGITACRIEAPQGAYSWLNDVPVVGSLVPSSADGTMGVDLVFYTVEAAAPPLPNR